MKQTELFLFDKVVNIDEDVAKFKKNKMKVKYEARKRTRIKFTSLWVFNYI